MTFQTAGFEAAVGFPAIAHGLDQMNAGVGKVITSKYQPTATEQLLVKAGVRLEQAVLIDSIMSIAATAGAIGAKKPLQAANYPQFRLPQGMKNNGWVLPLDGGGASINGRWYTEHALERMAPRTPKVMAELETRFAIREKIAAQKLFS
jgi:hypothetical protein